MRTREQYVTELAETVIKLFDDGVTDPSATEIAEAHFPGRALAGEIIESVRKRLHRVRDVLETDYDQPVCLLSYTYYSRFRSKEPTTEADARRCVPHGRGMHAAGVRVQVHGDADLIWQAMLQTNFSTSAGKMKKGANRVLDAVQDHRLSEPRAGSLLNRAKTQAEPESPALAHKVMTAPTAPKALPAKKGS